jgi:hypothetical protein
MLTLKIPLRDYVTRVAIAVITGDEPTLVHLLDDFLVDDLEAVPKNHNAERKEPQAHLHLRPP